ncbi:MAG TPA: prolyl oligopeptidase family serine peptidase [Bacteroidales bacterium]|nr:prolyl oligopeptidase family serine peptidase [Bacteroidales bacterium]
MNMKKLPAIFFLLLLTSVQIFAQRTGNIVDYFGTVRVTKTEEGDVFHRFTQGFALRGASRPGLLTGGEDIVSWQVATHNFEQPYHGKEILADYPSGRLNLTWESIEVDSAGIFTGGLRRAWVFTEFHSPVEGIALLEATGHTRVFINGYPREGDHYDYNQTLIPFHLKKGTNRFFFSHGRFGRVSARLIQPSQEVLLSRRDMTLPAILRGEREPKWGSIRVINSSNETLNGFSITCRLYTGESATIPMDHVIGLTTRKVKFQVPAPRRFTRNETVKATIIIHGHDGSEVHRVEVSLNQQDTRRHHERTFISQIDGSVQYFSVAPSTTAGSGQALVLSTHGASVEATNQTRAYQQKDWAHIVAPTNRRPFGFNWEEWGRLDALEVLEIGKKLFQTDPSKTYLTGHSMGGHGSWILGATYPDKFGAIGPAAGYADIIQYRLTGTDSAAMRSNHFEMIYRGALAGRTLYLAENLSSLGVYVLHGDADMVVPVSQARMMRTELARFHGNFVYHEQRGATHWDGNQAMDWPPLFDFLQQNTIPPINKVNKIDFRTASPGVSSTYHWVRINQQQISYEISRVDLRKANDTIAGTLQNVENITLFLSKLDFTANPIIQLNGQTIIGEKGNDLMLAYRNGVWEKKEAFDYSEKHPARYGGFKLAFTNNMVFVYATGGTPEENSWYQNKARFDAETWLYRANGSVDIVADKDFSPEQFAGRNVILFGNASNNKAWDALLADAPVRVENGQIRFGRYLLNGNDLGTYFIYPRPGCNFTSVGVIAGTGPEGMRALWPNDYFSGITGFPDLMIFTIDWLHDGVEKLKVSGFFGNDWSVEKGDFRFN